MLLYLKYNYMFSDLHVPEGLFKDIFNNVLSPKLTQNSGNIN